MSETVDEAMKKMELEDESVIDNIMQEIISTPKESVHTEQTPSTSSQPVITYPPCKNFKIPKTPKQLTAEDALKDVLETCPPRYVTPLDLPPSEDRQIVQVQIPISRVETPPHPRVRRPGVNARRGHSRSRNSNFRFQRRHYQAIGDAIFTMAMQENSARRPWYRHRRQPRQE